MPRKPNYDDKIQCTVLPYFPNFDPSPIFTRFTSNSYLSPVCQHYVTLDTPTGI